MEDNVVLGVMLSDATTIMSHQKPNCRLPFDLFDLVICTAQLPDFLFPLMERSLKLNEDQASGRSSQQVCQPSIKYLSIHHPIWLGKLQSPRTKAAGCTSLQTEVVDFIIRAKVTTLSCITLSILTLKNNLKKNEIMKGTLYNYRVKRGAMPRIGNSQKYFVYQI